MQQNSLTVSGLIALLLILTSCGTMAASGGESGTPGTPGATAATGRSTTEATPQIPPLTATAFSSPAPAPQGLQLHTDLSGYQPTSTITVSITNTSSQALYAWDTRASCTIFTLEMLTGGTWQPASVARCSLGRPAFLITIAPGEQYHATLQAQTPGLDTATFPVGTYRVVLSYATVPTLQAATNQVISKPFLVTRT